MPLLPSWLLQLPVLGLLAVRLVGQETASWGLRTRLDFSTVATVFKSVMAGSSGMFGAFKNMAMQSMEWEIRTLQDHELQGEQLVATCVKGRPRTVLFVPRSLGGGRVYRQTTGTEVSLLGPDEHSGGFSLATRRYPTFLGLNVIAAPLSRYRFRVHRETKKLDPTASLHVRLSAGKAFGWVAFFGLLAWLAFSAS